MDLTGGQIRDVGFRRANVQHIQKGRDGYVMRDFVWSELEGGMAAGLVIRQGEEGVSGVVQYKKGAAKGVQFGASLALFRCTSVPLAYVRKYPLRMR